MSDSKNLADIMSDIWADDDAIQHIFVLTYEFDENQLTNLLTCRDLTEEAQVSRRELLELARIRPLVAYDAAKTKESRSLPQLLELHPWKSRAYGCHHSKAYCIVTSTKVHLVLGSFNLTQSGLFHNREVMEYFFWSMDGSRNKESHILRQWVDFLRGQYLSRMQNSEHSALQQLIYKLDACCSTLNAPAQGDSALVYSGYNGEKKLTGLQKLRELWSQWFPGVEPTELLVVSPFFDQNPAASCVAKNFCDNFKKLKKIHICTAEESTVALCKGHFGPRSSKAECALFCIPRVTGEAERNVILAEAAAQQIAISEDQTLERKLHAKIVLLFNGERGISYAGSANFSCNAWLGRNQELGVARKERKISALRQKIFQGLYVEDKNIYATLPEVLTKPADLIDGEEELAHKLFPDFVEHIILDRNAENNTVRFVLHKGKDREGSVDDYNVTWGVDPLVLNFKSLSSQCIEAAHWQKRLFGGRNLAFIPKIDPSRIFWFPFQYSDAIINEKEYILNVTSTEWLLCYTSDSDQEPEKPKKRSKKDPDGRDDGDKIDRESNAVIAIQRYLQQFSYVEDAFRRHVDAILEDWGRSEAKQKSCHEQLKNTVFAPLHTFFTLLCKEHHEQSLNNDILALFAFRLCELLLFIQELSDVRGVGSDVCASPREDIKKYLRRLKRLQEAKDVTLQSYLAFVLKQVNISSPHRK